MLRNLRLFPLLLLVCVAHCNSCSSVSETIHSPPKPIPPTQGPSSGGPGGNNPSDFPTVANLNFAAFPQDTGVCNGTNIFHVSPSGNDANPGSEAQPFRSIVRALQSASSGDAVMVHGGTYAEGAVDPNGNPEDYRSLVVTQSNFSLCASPGETVTVEPRGGAFTYGMEIDGSNVRVEGINLSGYPTTLIQLGNGAPLQNIILKNLTATASGSSGKDGIATYNTQVDGLLISNVTVKNTLIGIQCNTGPCRHWRLDRVTVQNDPSQGDTGNDAIAIENGDNFLLSNVEVTGAAGDGLDFKGSNVAVFNANVHDNRRNGVKFWRGGDLVNSFVVKHGGDAAVVFDGAGTYRILNSLIAYENFPGGISYTLTAGYDLPQDVINLSIINSVFFSNAGAVAVNHGTQATVGNTLFTPTNTDEIMVIADQSGSGVMVMETHPASNLNLVATASGNLEFTTNPLFADPAVQDFSFPSQSPLRDAGSKPSLFPSYDFRGQPRVLGRAPDLGPLELF